MMVLISISEGRDKTRLANSIAELLDDSGHWEVKHLEMFEVIGEDREVHAFDIKPRLIGDEPKPN